MTFFETLQQQTEAARNTLLSAPIIQRTFVGDISRADYINFLTQAYHHVKHTTPLLMAAGSRMPIEKEWLRTALAEYIEEEVGHQEWILNDLEACGVDKETIRYAKPNPHTELMVAYAYHLIDRVNPVGFFGMVLVLEGTSIAKATAAADNIQATLALPDAAFSYLRSHGELDLSHMAFFESLMNQVNDEKDQQDVIHAANMFYHLYGNVFRSLTADARRIDECA